MKAYEIEFQDGNVYASTMAEVKLIIKDRDMYWPDLRVHECNVQSDKAGFIFALNRLPVIERTRTWRGTSRKGLKDMSEGVV